MSPLKTKKSPRAFPHRNDHAGFRNPKSRSVSENLDVIDNPIISARTWKKKSDWKRLDPPMKIARPIGAIGIQSKMKSIDRVADDEIDNNFIFIHIYFYN